VAVILIFSNEVDIIKSKKIPALIIEIKNKIKNNKIRECQMTRSKSNWELRLFPNIILFSIE